MKKKWLLVALIIFSAYGCSIKKKPVTDVDFNWRHPSELQQYLSDAVWTFNDGEELIFIYIEGNFELIKTARKDSDKNLGNCSELQSYSCYNHKLDQAGISGDYPYLKIGDQIYDFLEIKKDSFTLAGYNNGKPCTFFIKDKKMEVKEGSYQIDGRTYRLYLSEFSGSIIHEETGRRYEITVLDVNRFRIEATILSDIPVYRWWEDEKGNLVLLSEGLEVSGMSHEEIFNEFPVLVLEKVEE